MLRRAFLVAALALALVGASPFAQAQTGSWPQRPVKFIIPLGPGAGVDITARLIADRLAEKWGQPVVVENRPGGDAMVAITAVVGAKDDHMLLFAPASTFTGHPLLHTSLPYKADDLVPIARVTNTLIIVGVPTSLGVMSVKELTEKIKAAPGTLNFASVTGANDLLFLAFLKSQNLEMAKVPYKDTVQAVNDLAEGRIHAFVGAYATMRARIQQGTVAAIALTNRQAAPQLPTIPTAAAAGYKSLEFDGLVGVLGAKGFPDAAKQRIAKDIRDVVSDPAIAEKLTATGQVVNAGTAEEFAQDLKEQRDAVARIGNVLGIKAAE